MQSMTGYGRAAREESSVRVSARIRTVNHRYLDQAIRIGEDLRELEPAIRALTSERLHRGRVEVRVDVEDGREHPVDVRINHSWIAGLREVLGELEELQIETRALTVADLLRHPEALTIGISATGTEADELSNTVLETVEEALSQVTAMRAEEGERLAGILAGLLSSLQDAIGEVEAAQDGLRRQIEARYRQRLQEIAASWPELDEVRMGQEVATLIERSDVREELDRLGAHLDQFRASMLQPGAIGKKLDFIAQEILRELTTLGSKCRQSEVSEQLIEARLLCEQIREQVQNVE